MCSDSIFILSIIIECLIKFIFTFKVKFKANIIALLEFTSLVYKTLKVQI